MRITGNSYFLIVIMVAMLAIIGLALMMEYAASKLLPLILGSIVFILAGIGLAREILPGQNRKATASGTETGGGEETGERWSRYLLNGAWLAGFVLGIHLLGFIISIPVFLLAYMRWLGTKWLTSIACAVLTPLLIYVIFEVALDLDLYQGLVFKWLGYY